MMTGHLLLATTLAVSLAGLPATTPMDPLGIVTEANDAYLSNSSVSAGSTVYDGDRLSTEVDGTLQLRSSGAAMIYLAGDSRVTLHNIPDGGKGTEADLAKGTLVFSAAQATAMEVRADEASIRPAADAPTVGQITVGGPKKLYVYARRGSLIFSYRDESEVITEGQSYRVVLDPPDDGPAAKPDEDRPAPRPSRRRKGFLFFLLGIAAVPVIRHLFDSPESPYRP